LLEKSLFYFYGPKNGKKGGKNESWKIDFFTAGGTDLGKQWFAIDNALNKKAINEPHLY